MEKEANKNFRLAIERVQRVAEYDRSLLNLDSLGLTGKQLVLLLPAIISLRSLKIVFLRYNRLQYLPREISSLKGLEVLNLKGNALSELPSEIGMLSRLHTLNLSENRFSDFPLHALRVPLLRKLNVIANDISTFPMNVTLPNTYLEVNLQNNPIDSDTKHRLLAHFSGRIKTNTPDFGFPNGPISSLIPPGIQP